MAEKCGVTAPERLFIKGECSCLLNSQKRALFVLEVLSGKLLIWHFWQVVNSIPVGKTFGHIVSYDSVHPFSTQLLLYLCCELYAICRVEEYVYFLCVACLHLLYEIDYLNLQLMCVYTAALQNDVSALKSENSGEPILHKL